MSPVVLMVLSMLVMGTLQHGDHRPGCQSCGGNTPSLNHLNFLATLSGFYGTVLSIVGSNSAPTNSTLEIRLVSSGLVQLPTGGTLFAEEKYNNQVVRRSLYVTVERDNGNTIMFYPYNFTSEVSNMSGSFDKSKLNCLLPTELDYSHKCDRVVKPSSTQAKTFNFVSWPYCSESLENPPVVTAVLTCNTLTVNFTAPTGPNVFIVLTKTQKLQLPQFLVASNRRFKNPCP